MIKIFLWDISSTVILANLVISRRCNSFIVVMVKVTFKVFIILQTLLYIWIFSSHFFRMLRPNPTLGSFLVVLIRHRSPWMTILIYSRLWSDIIELISWCGLFSFGCYLSTFVWIRIHWRKGPVWVIIPLIPINLNLWRIWVTQVLAPVYIWSRCRLWADTQLCLQVEGRASMPF